MRLRGRIDAADASTPNAGRPLPEVSGLFRVRTTLVTGLAAVLIGVASTLLLRGAEHRPTQRVVATAPGERVTIHLADSSVVTLGPASSVRYLLSDTIRTLELVGLADFRVQHDPRRSFVVRARNAETIDLGTEFVIRAYPEDSTVTVSVHSGRVALTTVASRVTRQQLDAGAVGSVGADGTVVVQQRADVALYSAWMDGRLVFLNLSLARVATELGRNFDVDVRIPDAALSGRHVSGIYSDASLSSVLEALMATLGARYERHGRVITISPLRR